MLLSGPVMKAAMQARIYAGLQRVFASDTDSRVNVQWMLIADAISDVALDIVLEIQTDAEVASGQTVVGSLGAGVAISPGKII